MFSHAKAGELKARFTAGEGQTRGLVPVVIDCPSFKTCSAGGMVSSRTVENHVT